MNLCVFCNFVVCNSFDNCRCYFLSHLIIAACLFVWNNKGTKKFSCTSQKHVEIPRLAEKIHLPSAAMLHGQRAYFVMILQYTGQGGDVALIDVGFGGNNARRLVLSYEVGMVHG